MISISPNKIIRFMRGDSLTIPLNKIYDEKKIILNKSDKLYLGIMEPNQRFEDSIIRKSYDYYSKRDSNKNIIIRLEPEDTEFLRPGKYYYMLKLLTYNEDGFEDIDTLIPSTLFWLEGNNNRFAEDKTDEVVDIIQVYQGGHAND